VPVAAPAKDEVSHEGASGVKEPAFTYEVSQEPLALAPAASVAASK
jgi:hypothetical protein